MPRIDNTRKSDNNYHHNSRTGLNSDLKPRIQNNETPPIVNNDTPLRDRKTTRIKDFFINIARAVAWPFIALYRLITDFFSSFTNKKEEDSTKNLVNEERNHLESTTNQSVDTNLKQAKPYELAVKIDNCNIVLNEAEEKYLQQLITEHCEDINGVEVFKKSFFNKYQERLGFLFMNVALINSLHNPTVKSIQRKIARAKTENPSLQPTNQDVLKDRLSEISIEKPNNVAKNPVDKEINPLESTNNKSVDTTRKQAKPYELSVKIDNCNIVLNEAEEKYLQELITKHCDDINDIKEFKNRSFSEYKERLESVFITVALSASPHNPTVKSIQRKIDRVKVENPSLQPTNQDVLKDRSSEISIAPPNNVAKNPVDKEINPLKSTNNKSVDTTRKQAKPYELAVKISNRNIVLNSEEEKYLQRLIQKHRNDINTEACKTIDSKVGVAFSIGVAYYPDDQIIKSIKEKIDRSKDENPSLQRINQDVPKNLPREISIAPLENFACSCWFNSIITQLKHILSIGELEQSLAGYIAKINAISQDLSPYARACYTSFINLNKALERKDNKLVIDELRDFFTALARFTKKVSEKEEATFTGNEDFYPASLRIFKIFSPTLDENDRVRPELIDKHDVSEFIDSLFLVLQLKTTANSLNILKKEELKIDTVSLNSAFKILGSPQNYQDSIIINNNNVEASTTTPVYLFSEIPSEEKIDTTTNLLSLNDDIKNNKITTKDSKKLQQIISGIEKNNRKNKNEIEVSAQKTTTPMLQSNDIQKLKSFIVGIQDKDKFYANFPSITTIINDAETGKDFTVTSVAKNFTVRSNSKLAGHYSSFSILNNFEEIIVHDDSFQGTLNQFYKTKHTDKTPEYFAEFNNKDLPTRLKIVIDELGKIPMLVLYQVTSIKEV